MRILVTGASGFSGSFVARALARSGRDVVALHRRETPFLTRLSGEPRVRKHRGDLIDAATLPGPFDAVVHVAATSPAPGIDVAQMVRDNVMGTQALIEAAERWAAKAFIFFSSLSLYGEVAAGLVDERTPIVNPDVYGATKHLGELLLAARAERLLCLAIRLPGVLGPGAHRNWLSGVAARLRTGETVRAFHLDAPFNNAAHIADLAALVSRVLERPWTGFDAIVAGARGHISVREAIIRLAKGLGLEARIEQTAAAKPSFTLSSERAISRWGYDPMEIGAMIDRYAEDVRAG
ncbi:MAG: NAD(P)-dependent oxidoreductase [Hyphomicrobiaceae bacterium]|nr:MAG: NAD(P)-dependent oxidoreductase [Hyphomicrobiaceae bacterium]